ncbi:MAG: YaeQ family protein [Burkholderiales bacterium]
MALKATIFKAELQIADMDRHYYGDHVLTIARHPSETDERMMVRLLAFALRATERLEFGRGLSAEDEADIGEKDLTGSLITWIDVGLPDERRLRKACGRARSVFVYAYGGRAVDLWWSQAADALNRCDNLEIWNLPHEATQSLARLASRNMKLQCTVQEGQIWLGDGASVVQLEAACLRNAKNP